MTQPTEKQTTPLPADSKPEREAVRDRLWDEWNAVLYALQPYDLDEAAQFKLAVFQDTLGLLFGDDEAQDHGVEQHEFQTEHGRITAGAQVPRRQRGRHDEKAVPAGYVYQRGFLGKKRDLSEPEPSVFLAAKQLLVSLGAMFTVEDGAHGTRNLGSIIHLLLGDATPRAESVNKSARWLEKTLMSWREHDGSGRPPWERFLEGQLEMDAVHREEARQQRAHGHQPRRLPDIELLGELGEQAKNIPWGSFDRPASGQEMLAYLEYAGIEVPDALTPALIEELREQVGLNKGGRPAAGGRSKKTARAVVDDFAKQLK
jgi:hypothetical protein